MCTGVHTLRSFPPPAFPCGKLGVRILWTLTPGLALTLTPGAWRCIRSQATNIHAQTKKFFKPLVGALKRGDIHPEVRLGLHMMVSVRAPCLPLPRRMKLFYHSHTLHAWSGLQSGHYIACDTHAVVGLCTRLRLLMPCQGSLFGHLLAGQLMNPPSALFNSSVSFLATAWSTQAMKERNYLKAYDVYMRISVGNAPWPIGVTSVGIHERSAREKISFSCNGQAHIMNDEATRKYLQVLGGLCWLGGRKQLCSNHQASC